MIVDAHSHPHDTRADLAALLADMDAHGIQKAWILSWECPGDEYEHIPGEAPEDKGPDPWEAVRSFYRNAGGRLVLGYAPDFRDPDALDLIKTGIQNYHVSVCGEVKLRSCYDSPDALRIFRHCGEHGVPVVVHYAYEYFTGRDTPRASWWYGGDIFCLERLLRLCPGTNFIAGGPGLWRHFADDPQEARSPYEGEDVPGLTLTALLEQCGNLYCHTAGEGALAALQADRRRTQGLFHAFGQRLLFGRGGLGNRLQGFVDALALPQGLRDGFYAGNAERLIAGIRR